MVKSGFPSQLALGMDKERVIAVALLPFVLWGFDSLKAYLARRRDRIERERGDHYSVVSSAPLRLGHDDRGSDDSPSRGDTGQVKQPRTGGDAGNGVTQQPTV